MKPKQSRQLTCDNDTRPQQQRDQKQTAQNKAHNATTNDMRNDTNSDAQPVQGSSKQHNSNQKDLA